jgi:predicted DNA-binding protein YlxM (UPF0122 family)
MTKEVAKKIAKGIADKIECNTSDIDDWAKFWGFTQEDYEEFLDMAVKASEQTDTFDNIKTEIEQTFLDDAAMQEYTVEQCLKIIDKHAPESEK